MDSPSKHAVSACYNRSVGIVLGLLAAGLLGSWIVNYLADVLPLLRGFGEPLCPQCAAVMPWSDYLLLRRCRTCHSPRPLRTFIVIAILPVAAIFLWLVPPHQLEVPTAIGLLCYLVLIVAIDIEHRLILHILSLAGAALGLAIGIHLHGLVSTLIGGAAGYGIMLSLFFLGIVFVRVVSRRRKEAVEEQALGYGDVNLAGVAGLLLGWPGIIFGLLVTILAAGVISLVVLVVMLVRRKYHAFSAIPYGPFLVLSIVLLLFRP
jgi:prepilin signal peptidase PulO-like enzyme (type II secretory pathway)